LLRRAILLWVLQVILVPVEVLRSHRGLRR
jgi:hypothetical protein